MQLVWLDFTDIVIHRHCCKFFSVVWNSLQVVTRLWHWSGRKIFCQRSARHLSKCLTHSPTRGQQVPNWQMLSVVLVSIVWCFSIYFWIWRSFHTANVWITWSWNFLPVFFAFFCQVLFLNCDWSRHTLQIFEKNWMLLIFFSFVARHLQILHYRHLDLLHSWPTAPVLCALRLPLLFVVVGIDIRVRSTFPRDHRIGPVCRSRLNR